MNSSIGTRWTTAELSGEEAESSQYHRSRGADGPATRPTKGWAYAEIKKGASPLREKAAWKTSRGKKTYFCVLVACTSLDNLWLDGQAIFKVDAA